MVLHPLRLRRALSISLSVLRSSRQGPRPISCGLLSAPSRIPTPTRTHTLPTLSSYQTATRFFTSTTSLLWWKKPSVEDPLISGKDYNHWLIYFNFPKDSNLTPDQMIDTYVNTAAQVFGSVEEAKKKIYGVHTTTLKGFHVECSEEIAYNKLRDLPGVENVFADVYWDRINKEYGGDKYVNGEIFPRPPPRQYSPKKRKRDKTRRVQQHGQPVQYGEIPIPGLRLPAPGLYGQGPTTQQNYGGLLQYGQKLWASTVALFKSQPS